MQNRIESGRSLNNTSSQREKHWTVGNTQHPLDLPMHDMLYYNSLWRLTVVLKTANHANLLHGVRRGEALPYNTSLSHSDYTALSKQTNLDRLNLMLKYTCSDRYCSRCCSSCFFTSSSCFIEASFWIFIEIASYIKSTSVNHKQK